MKGSNLCWDDYVWKVLSQAYIGMRKYLELELDFASSVTILWNIFTFRDLGINFKFWAAFVYRSFLKINKNVKVIYEDNLTVIKYAFEIGNFAE